MIRKTWLVGLVLFFAFAKADSQSVSSAQHLAHLQEGTLLVQLNTASDKIAKLNSYGYKKEAIKVAAAAEKENADIMKQFDAYYLFSKYCFYYSDDSDKLVKENDLSVLIDSEGNPIDQKNMGSTYLLFYTYPLNSIKRETKSFILNNINDNKVERIESIDVGYYKSGNGLKSVFSRLFNPSKSNMNDQVKYLNNKLSLLRK